MFMAFIKHNNLPVSMLRFPSYLPKRASDGTKIMVAPVLQQQLHLDYSSKQKLLMELNLVPCKLFACIFSHFMSYYFTIINVRNQYYRISWKLQNTTGKKGACLCYW